ncbi:Rhomboid-like protein [Thalictrum thalictroides]|uniref:RHOMBOID-like protein n=1 Tax=Thalictrum thalictroides TaxID=46969 RepID=A0A7J6XEB8_THATH|nr:Rhomboid-like protein [Thalictrum thalictroides]
MEESINEHFQLEIKCPVRLSTDGSWQTPTTPFFNSRSKSKSNTWIISFFVVIHLVAFAATMIVNDCSRNSNGNCVFPSLGRISFQPFSENPLLGPSSSTLDKMGALQQKLLIQQHQMWRLLTGPWLHAGIIDLLINLSSVIFVGIYLEQVFGSVRVGLVYTLSAFVGSLLAALFVKNNPAVASSGALFGLLGAMLSALIRNWKIYSDKYTASVTLFLLVMFNITLGLLPHVDNFSNLGGFVSGILLGFVFFFDPLVGQVPHNKRGLFEYNDKSSVQLKHKLDKPLMRGISLVLFSLVFAGGLVAVLHGVNARNYCTWCHLMDCLPCKWWTCNDNEIFCKVTVSAGRLTLACKNNDNYRMYLFADISQARIGDLCTTICS